MAFVYNGVSFSSSFVKHSTRRGQKETAEIFFFKAIRFFRFLEDARNTRVAIEPIFLLHCLIRRFRYNFKLKDMARSYSKRRNYLILPIRHPRRNKAAYRDFYRAMRVSMKTRRINYYKKLAYALFDFCLEDDSFARNFFIERWSDIASMRINIKIKPRWLHYH